MFECLCLGLEMHEKHKLELELEQELIKNVNKYTTIKGNIITTSNVSTLLHSIGNFQVLHWKCSSRM